MKTFIDFLTEATPPPSGPPPSGGPPMGGGMGGPPGGGPPIGGAGGPPPMGGGMGGPPPMGGGMGGPPMGMDGGPPGGPGATPPPLPPMEFKPSSVWHVIHKLLSGEKVGIENEKKAGNDKPNMVSSQQQPQPTPTDPNIPQQGQNQQPSIV